MGGSSLDSRKTAGGRKRSASARALFDPSRPLPYPLSFAMLQGQGQLGTRVWEEYGGRIGQAQTQHRKEAVSLGWERAPQGQPRLGRHVPIGCWGN